MASTTADVWIAFNGEIYGYRRLRSTLETEGCQFRTESDTEVILNAYLQWGDSFIDRIDGMFAIALLDERTQKVTLYRDRCGIKPLYYHWDGQHFAFASELKAIETLVSRGSLQIDSTACYDFLTYRYVPTPKTLYRNVFKLPSAHRLVFDLTRQEIAPSESFWRLADSMQQPFTAGIDDACDELRARITASIRDQLVADVPLGFFLSGGIDSSIVVATASQHRSPLRTFSIGFEPEEESELKFARLVAENFGTIHKEKIYPRTSIAEEFKLLREWFGEPFADLSAFPTYLVSETAREEVTVALSGDGGDELFGGYAWYSYFRRLRHLALGKFPRLTSWIDRKKNIFDLRTTRRRLYSLVALIGDDEFALYTRLMSGMTRSEKAKYRSFFEVPEDYDDYWFFRRHWRANLPLLTRLQYLDFHTFLPDDVLTKVDRASMAHSLEVRVPLLSREIVEFAFSLPEGIRLLNGESKGLLKRTYRDTLPAEIVNRQKRGFSTPFAYYPDKRQRIQELVLTQLFDLHPQQIG